MIDFLIRILLGYMLLNVGTYLISIFYMTVLRLKDGSVGYWFFKWNKFENPKEIAYQQLLIPIMVFTLYLPAILLHNVQCELEDEKKKEKNGKVVE